MSKLRHSYLAFACAGILVLVYCAHALRIYSSNLVNDDAFIYFRYAEHWAQGHGFVWNIGESPVNGFTSITYVLLLGWTIRFGFSPLAASQFIGLISAVGVLLFTMHLARMIMPEAHPLAVAFPSLTLALSPEFVKWSRFGMETPFFIALLLLAWIAHFRSIMHKERTYNRILPAAFFLLAALTRLEAVLFWCVAEVQAFTSILAFSRQEVESPANWGALARRAFQRRLPGIICFSLPLGLFFIWSATTFGSALPNTFYAKSAYGARLPALIAGFEYLSTLLGVAIAIPLWLLPLALAARKQLTKIQRAFGIYTIVSTASIFVYTISVGGDHFPGYRFYLFLTPLIFIFALLILLQLGSELRIRITPGGKVIVPVVAIAYLIFLVLPSLEVAAKTQGTLYKPLRLVDEYDGSNPIQHQRELIGHYLREIARPDESVAVIPAGAIPYYSKLRTLDMLGLNDPILARQPVDRAFVEQNPRGWVPGHVKGDGVYILNKRPTFIILSATLEDQPMQINEWALRNYRPTLQLWQANLFHQCYQMISVPLAGGYFTYHKLKAECATQP